MFAKLSLAYLNGRKLDGQNYIISASFDSGPFCILDCIVMRCIVSGLAIGPRWIWFAMDFELGIDL